ncbi:CLUMA_CG001408, isoform A [Clunio marinus]|uniref:CLUMA_CG001408, isoform A n=1 Tax=Clunio marinus TaxID=568069 RepID=A0A1J1HJM3_9DIPT|nr:CLUMA_CG001408, isoform A [Clunio marinus]
MSSYSIAALSSSAISNSKTVSPSTCPTIT